MEIAIKINNKEEYLEAKEILIKEGFLSDDPWNEYISNDMINDNNQHYLILDSTFFGLHNHNASCEIIYNNINEFLKENDNR